LSGKRSNGLCPSPDLLAVVGRDIGAPLRGVSGRISGGVESEFQSLHVDESLMERPVRRHLRAGKIGTPLLQDTATAARVGCPPGEHRKGMQIGGRHLAFRRNIVFVLPHGGGGLGMRLADLIETKLLLLRGTAGQANKQREISHIVS
jgi:hypothetical protein